MKTSQVYLKKLHCTYLITILNQNVKQSQTVKLYCEISHRKINPHCKRTFDIKKNIKIKINTKKCCAHFHPVERHAHVISRDSGESVSFHQDSSDLRHAQSHSD